MTSAANVTHAASRRPATRHLQRGLCAGMLLAATVLAPLSALAGPVGVAPPVGMAPVDTPSAATPPTDLVTRFLSDRGLLDASAIKNSALVQEVRDRASDLVLSAMNFIGVPYRRGGNSAEDGFDCSGFTRHVFDHSLGLVLPRRAEEQARAPGLFAVRRDELKPGDLVFFNTLRQTFSHVGIYVGEGKFIHAPRTGSQVRIEDMSESYWAKRFTGARRAPQAEIAATPGIALPSTLNALPAPSDVADGMRDMVRSAVGVRGARPQ